MKKILIIIIVSLFYRSVSFAQTYTDEDIMNVDTTLMKEIQLKYSCDYYHLDEVSLLQLKRVGLKLYEGLMFQNKKMYDSAVNKYKQQVTETDNKYTFKVTYNNLGAIYYAQAKYSEAIDCFRIAVAADSSENLPLRNLGIVYRHKVNMNNIALRYFQKALEVNPNDVISLINIAGIYNDEKKYDDAIKYLKMAEIINPNYLDVYIEMSYIYYSLEKYNEGNIYIDKAIELNRQCYTYTYH